MSTTTDSLREQTIQELGARLPAASEAIDGEVPAAVLEPTTPEQLAAALAWASSHRATTVVYGGGSKLGWGRAPRRIDLGIRTTRLDRILAHRHGDLTATIQSGARLVDVNQQLAREGQWLPVDSAFDAATIGGIVSTNDAGPLRARYGTPRDLVIGMSLALTDGRLTKSGGHVVKNVAGYDLGRLMSGACGCLAALVDVTVKLLPLPAASQTLVVSYGDSAALASAVVRLADSQLEPTAFDLCLDFAAGSVSRHLLVRFATSPESARLQTAAARLLLVGETRVVEGAEEAQVWRHQVDRPWEDGRAVIRLSWLPAALAGTLSRIEGVLAQTQAQSVRVHARASVATGVVSLVAADDAVERLVHQLRAAGSGVANVVVLRQSAALKSRLDPWGDPPRAAAVMNALKQSFDPAGILNAGRGPI